MTAVQSQAYRRRDSAIVKKRTLSQKEVLLDDFRIAFLSRLASNHIRKEVLMGKAKFGIGGGGKELLQIALAKAFQKGDYFSGYYRDQTFMLKKRLATVADLFASLYGDIENDLYSGGRQMNNHFATPFVDKKGAWTPLQQQYNVASAISPLAGHAPRALGIAQASQKLKTNAAAKSALKQSGQEVSFCIVGDATTSEGVFLETINAAGVMQVPMVFVVQDDGYGISVSTRDQTTKGSISEALRGFESKKPGEGLTFHTAKAWDYVQLHQVFKNAVSQTRTTHKPCLIHITECTQANGHSTSGSHERYKSTERLQWEKDNDCLLKLEAFLLKKKVISEKELVEFKITLTAEFKQEKQKAWADYQITPKKFQAELSTILNKLVAEFSQLPKLQLLQKELRTLTNISVSDVLRIAEKAKLLLALEDSPTLSTLNQWHQQYQQQLQQEYATNLYSHSARAAINVPIVQATFSEDGPYVNGHKVLNEYFDQLFKRDHRVYAFGEDVGQIGGVNQAFAGLQEKYGKDRIFDTGIREWTIAGQAIGMAMRGLRPIGEIQYLDYLVYALPALTDDLATLRWRTDGQQIAPAIIRTRGHRLEGIWHSGSPMGMLLGSLRGMYLLTPRNMTQAAGMYNTMLQSDDPAIIIECLNGYRKKEQVPTNLDSFTVPLGVPETLVEGTDITLVTYGACVAEAEKAVAELVNLNISVELIDIQTLLPFDLEHRIVESLKKTSKVIFLDEDVPGGATAYMMQKVLEEQNGYRYLDAAPLTISAKAYRAPYADNGNYVCKPSEHDIIVAAVEMMNEVEPKSYQKIARNLI